eukprot:2655779-Pleurochrysis_carterae.AAC.3
MGCFPNRLASSSRCRQDGWTGRAWIMQIVPGRLTVLRVQTLRSYRNGVGPLTFRTLSATTSSHYLLQTEFTLRYANTGAGGKVSKFYNHHIANLLCVDI